MNAITNVPNPTKLVETKQIDVYDVRELITDGVQACIMLDEQRYFLRITRAGKLILTK